MPISPERLGRATPDDPLRVLFSACLLGRPTGWEGTGYPAELALQLAGLANVRALTFCPEDVALGTPRPLTTLYGGNGDDVWAGRARVLDTDGTDQTEPLKAGAEAMVARAREGRAELCVLLEMSDSCGTRVVYDEVPGRYRRGPGVAASALVRAGFPVLSPREVRTLSGILGALDPGYQVPAEVRDVDEEPWFQEMQAGWAYSSTT